MKVSENLLDLTEKAIAEFLKGKTIKVADCHEFAFILVFGDDSTMKVDIDLDIAGDPFLEYELDGRNPYKW